MSLYMRGQIERVKNKSSTVICENLHVLFSLHVVLLFDFETKLAKYICVA